MAKAPNKTGRRLKGRNQGNKSYMLEAISRHLRSQVATETAQVTSFHKPTRRIQIRRNFGAIEKSPSAQSQQQTSKVQDGPCRRQMSGKPKHVCDLKDSMESEFEKSKIDKGKPILTSP